MIARGAAAGIKVTACEKPRDQDGGSRTEDLFAREGIGADEQLLPALSR